MILEGKVALVTGSTSGIGLAIARALAAEGAAVMLNGFGEAPEIERLCSELGALHDPADLSDPSSIETMLALVPARNPVTVPLARLTTTATPAGSAAVSK